MNLFELHRNYREALAVWEALRRLGFPPGAIFFAHGPALHPDIGIVKDCVSIILETQGKKFAITVGPIQGTYDQVTAQWKRICEALPEISDEVLGRVWRESQMSSASAFVDLVSAIERKGIALPRQV